MTWRPKILFMLSKTVWQRCLERAGLYRALTTREAIERHQVKIFNQVWQDAFTDVPFYTQWKEEHHLPESIVSLDELETWPVISKRELQKNVSGLLRLSGKPTGYMMTGGSTGEPLRFGTWPDVGVASSSQWIGRAAYGFDPGVRQFILWGHRHLYGKGMQRKIKTALRFLKDRLSNMRRVSAYDLSAPAMRQAFNQFITFNPEVVIGFSAAVVAFCRVNADQRDLCRKLGIKFSLCTAGPLSVDEKKMIEDFFNAPVCMEYGSVECGVMAYTTPETGEYTVFWDTHILQTKCDDYGNHRNIVTRLTHCYVPLIRYDIADFLEVFPNEVIHPLRFSSVKGRPSDIVKLADGSAFFGAVIGDCVKQVPRVLACQTIVRGNALEIDVMADGDLTETESELISDRCRLAVASLQNHEIVVHQKMALQMGRGGKVPLVIYE